MNNLNISERKKFPKISIISPVFNRCQYLLRFLKSIQNQNFNDIEIILIDDFSSDNSVSLIKQYQLIDKRILLIRNKKNYGTFRSRNFGILKSKGEYIILPDPDDILLQNSLIMLYNYAIKYNYEMLRFNLYIGKGEIFFLNFVKSTPSRAIYQPELKTFLFYASGKLLQIDFNVTNKFIKREALIRALNLLSKEYLNIYMINFEDGLLNYILYRIVKSFYFLKKICYYYIINPLSITTKQLDKESLKAIFIYLKIVLEYSKNDIYEKNMFNSLLKNLVISDIFMERIHLMKSDLKFYFEIIDMILRNEFVSINNKNFMIKLKDILIKIL